MTRETTDGLYVELGYTTPEDYFVYVAEAAAQPQAIVSLDSDPVYTAGGVGSLSVSVAISVDAQVIKNSAAALDFNFAQSADADRVRTATVDSEATADIDATTGFLRDQSVDFESIAITLAAAGVIGDFFVPMDLNATVTADVDRVRTTNSAQSVSFAQTAAAQVTAGADADLLVRSLAQVSKWNGSGRPRNGNVFNPSNRVFIDNTVFKDGSGSLRLQASSDTRTVFGYNGLLPIDSDDDFVFEFWVRFSDLITTTAGYVNLFQTTTALGSELIRIQHNINGFVKFILFNTEEYTSSAAIPNFVNTWHKVQLRRTNGTLVGSFSGVQIFSVANTNSFNIQNMLLINSRVRDVPFVNYNTRYNNVRFDSFSFRIGDSTVFGNDIPINNFDTTQMIYLFDSNYNDYLGITETAAAELPVTVSIRLRFPEVQEGAADLQAQFSSTTVLAKVLESSADLSIASALTAEADKIVQTLAAMDAAATLTAELGRVQEITATLAAKFDFTVEPTLIPPVEASADLTAEFTVTAQDGFVKETAANFVALASTLTAVGKVSDSFVPMDNNFQVTADARVIRGALSDITAQFDSTVELNRIRTSDSSSDAVAEVNVLTGYLQDLNAQLIAEFAINALVDGIIPGAADLEIASSFVVSLDRIRSDSAEIALAVEVEVEPNALFDSNTAMNSLFGVFADVDARRFIEADADLLAQFALSATGVIRNIDQYVYRIPHETRTINIQRENRTIRVRR